MRITRVIGSNVKGLDFDYQLAPVTIITGSNDSGKTAVPDAIKVALMGYQPRLGKQGSATMDLAGDQSPEMRCLVELEDGQQAWRGFKIQGGEVNGTDKQQIANVEILDMEEFFARERADQLAFILTKIDTAAIKFDDAALLEKLQELEALPAAEGVAGRNEMIAVVQKSILRRNNEKVALQTWLEQLIDSLKAEKKAKEAERKTHSGGSQTLKIERVPTNQKEQISKIEASLAEATKRLTELRFQQKQHDGQKARRDTLRGIVNEPIQDSAPLQKEKTKLEKSTQGYALQVPAAEALVKKLRDEYQMFHVEHSQILSQKEERQKALDNLGKQKKCPFCRSSRKDWQDEARKEYESEIAALDEKIKVLVASKEDVTNRGKTAADALKSAEAADNAFRANQERIRQIEGTLGKIRGAESNRRAAEAELAGLEQALPMPSLDEIAQLEANTAEMERQVTELNQQQFQFDQYEAGQVKRKQLEKAGLACQARIEIYKQAIAIVTEKQQAVIAQAFDSILAPARRVTDGVLPGRLEYRNGSIGLFSDRGWEKYTTFAGNKRTIIFAALAVALAQQSPVKVCVVDELGTIEAPRKKALVQRLIELTREKFIDNAICCDLSADDYADLREVNVGEFSIIELS